MVRFRILGPIECFRGQRRCGLGGPRQLALLAVLLLHANRAVSADALIDALWGEQSSAGATKRLQMAIARLRKALDGDGAGSSGEPVLRTLGGAYLLALAPGELDADVFAANVQDGRRALDAGEPARAAELLRDALGLWRGPALAEVAYAEFAQAEIRRLEELRLAALEARVDADLQLGLHAALIGELDALVAREPLREHLYGQRMLALYRSGRQAEALEAYQQARTALVEQIGLEPGPQLARLQQAILVHDPKLDVPGPLSGASAAELPAGVVTFLFTDIEGSTRLWEREPEGMARALERHDELIARAVEASSGCLLKSKGEGDSTLSVFRRASDAVACAAGLQAALTAASWPAGLELRVRVAVHTGEAHERDSDYFGPALNRAARLRSLARGGATVVSQATTEIVHDRLPPELELVDVGRHELPGLSRPEHVFELRPRAGAPPQEGAPVTAPTRLPLPRPLRAATDFPFVGRDRELARLHELWAQAPHEVRAVIVGGEAGIGKTRLAAELARAVHDDGALVLYGRCDEGLAVPYQPFVEALRPAARVIGLDRLRAELGPQAPNLARLWPELEALGEPPHVDPETDRYRLFEAVNALLEAAARERPTLLVLDDLQWAAQPTLLMLRHLIRSERPLGAFVLGTRRTTELAPDHQLGHLLADLQRDMSVASVPIRGLDERAIAALLEAAAGHTLDERAGELVRVLQAETAGNPFFIRELLAHLVESRAVYRAGERWTTDLPPGRLALPEGLRQVIRQRVARLSKPARRALGVAAVAGPGFSLALLERVLGEPSELLDGLDEAIAAGVLTESGPGEYAFAHALVRQTIYEQHSAARRMRLHRRLGEALEALPGADAHVEVLAYHFAHAAADGQAAKAASYAVSAGERATARVAYEDAATHYDQGLRALELTDPRDEARRGELLLALADAHWSSGKINSARDTCRLAAELADSRGDSGQLARAALGFAGPVRLEVAKVVTEPLIGLLDRALGALGENESALRARIMGRLAAALTMLDAERRRPALARQAIAMARRLEDKRALADVLASTYIATWEPDNLDARRATADELAGLAHQVGDDSLAAVTRSLIVSNLLEQGDIDAAERELTALQRQTETLRQHYPRALAAVGRARHAHLAGHLADYEALANEFRARGLESRDEQARHVLAGQMLYLRREQGRLSELVESAGGVARGEGGAADRYLLWRCGIAFAHAELDRRPDARRDLEALARNDFSDFPRDWLWLASLSTLSPVVAYLDDAPRAELLYEMLLPYAELCVGAWMPFCLGSASRPLGLLATTLERFDAAAIHFEDALEMNTKIRSPLWVAHTQHDYARTLLRRDQPGDREHALKLLDAALATANKLGLKALADRALRLMSQAQASRLA
jgi:DNA-binding SARP family transcriptional activator